MTARSIADLPALIAALSPEIRSLCERIFRVSVAHGRLYPPETMHDWIASHFGSSDAATQQTTIKVANRLTLEATLFNPLRGQRPQDTGADTNLDHEIMSNLETSDIFRDPLAHTPADSFGRIRGEYCVTASNIAKYDGWHGVVIFDEPHPLHFGHDQVVDYITTALRWLDAAHEADPRAIYPIVTWNCLWKSGASLLHGHIQMALAHDAPYAATERWERAARDYRTRYDEEYVDALKLIHRSLGLTFVDHDKVIGYATLTPFKNREVHLFAPLNNSRTFPQALAEATYCALRSLIDREGMRSFNLAIYPPPYASLADIVLPWCVRIVDRGNPVSRMVDMGAMELFGSSVVSADPFAVAQSLRVDRTT